MKAAQPDSHFGEQATVRSKIRTKTEWTTWQPNERKLFERNPPHQVPNRRYRWTSQGRLTGNKTLKCQNDGESVQRKTKSFKVSGFWSLERTSYLRLFFIEFHHYWNFIIQILSLKSGRFLPFKTPLDDRYSNKLPAELFIPEMIFELYRSQGTYQIGLWIDLTATKRY